MKKKRTNYSAKEKVAIVRKHLLEGGAVSELCEKHGIHPTVFYRWQKALFENGEAAFDKPKGARADGSADCRFRAQPGRRGL